jgi:thioredoxin 1
MGIKLLMGLFPYHLRKTEDTGKLNNIINTLKNRTIMTKKNLLIAALIAITPCSYLIFSKNGSGNNVIYLHKEHKTTRSSEAHLHQFSSTGNVVIDFYADWCPPCKRMSPLIDGVATIMPEVTFIKINRDYFLDLANLYNITSIPTLIFLKDGKEIGRYNGGPLTQDKLASLITKTYRNA